MNDELEQAREALADALSMEEGPDRRRALQRAVDHRAELGAGDEQLTNALTQLGRWEDAEQSLLDECALNIEERPRSPMMVGVWGRHLVLMFKRFGEDARYKAWRRFANEAFARNGAAARLIYDALRHASVDDDDEEFRRHMFGTLDNALLLWRAKRAGYEPEE